MTKQSTTTRTELASRSSNGVEVTLIWGQRDGIDELVVCVSDARAGAYFEIPAEPGRALDVYYHPFAYRDPFDLSGGAWLVIDEADAEAATALLSGQSTNIERSN